MMKKQKNATEFNAVYEKFSDANLIDENEYAKLNDIIDVKEYLEYIAIESYFYNTDWPHNNFGVYI